MKTLVITIPTRDVVGRTVMGSQKIINTSENPASIESGFKAVYSTNGITVSVHEFMDVRDCDLTRLDKLNDELGVYEFTNCVFDELNLEVAKATFTKCTGIISTSREDIELDSTDVVEVVA